MLNIDEPPTTSIQEAVASRRAVRCFRPEPVDETILRRVLAAAQRAPSGGNLQPWCPYLVIGEALGRLKAELASRVAAWDPGDERQYDMYPADLPATYRARQERAAGQRYRAAGIRRDDRDGRRRAVARNWQAFDAPAVLFCFLPAVMGPPQWADAGMYLQTVMLLARAEGLDTCPQMAWSVYWRTVAAAVGAPEDLVLFCGVSIGHAAESNAELVDRAAIDEVLTVLR